MPGLTVVEGIAVAVRGWKGKQDGAHNRGCCPTGNFSIRIRNETCINYLKNE